MNENGMTPLDTRRDELALGGWGKPHYAFLDQNTKSFIDRIIEREAPELSAAVIESAAEALYNITYEDAGRWNLASEGTKDIHREEARAALDAAAHVRATK